MDFILFLICRLAGASRPRACLQCRAGRWLSTEISALLTARPPVVWFQPRLHLAAPPVLSSPLKPASAITCPAPSVTILLSPRLAWCLLKCKFPVRFLCQRLRAPGAHALFRNRLLQLIIYRSIVSELSLSPESLSICARRWRCSASSLLIIHPAPWSVSAHVLICSTGT